MRTGNLSAVFVEGGWASRSRRISGGNRRTCVLIGGVRWQGQTLAAEDPDALPGLETLSGVPGLVRTVRTPEFAGITFHEVRCRSALNQVPEASRVPFRWTINPYRGCTHGCVYCFARNTHTYLDLDAGSDFDSQIVVKINIAEVLRRELARPRWTREHVAMGTNTDPYQRAEGRYRLMPEVITGLAQSGTPFSILTKGTLLSRDLPLLAEAGRQVKVGVAISLALLDPELHATLEPGTPTPAGPAQPGSADPRGRAVLRGAGRADPALPHRLQRAAGGAGRRDLGRRCDQHQRDRPASAARRPGVVLQLARAASTRTWCRRTSASTPAAPTCRSRTRRTCSAGFG